MFSVVFRADASTRIGSGHIFRCLVLAEELRKHEGRSLFVCKDLEGHVFQRIRMAGFDLAILPADLSKADEILKTSEICKEFSASWFIADHYGVDDAYMSAFQKAGYSVMAIDDVNEHPFSIDLLLNQNLDSDLFEYITSPETVRLLGPKYALIRPSYRKARPSNAPHKEQIRRILVFMGGGDPDNATGKMLNILEKLASPMEIRVIIGGGFPYRSEILAQAEASRHAIRVEQNLPDLVEPLSWADIFVSAGGSVTWEACCLGVPMAILNIADNQEAIAAAIERHRAGIRLGRAEIVSKNEILEKWNAAFSQNGISLREMAANAYGLADGRGAERVAKKLIALTPAVNQSEN